MPWLAQHLTLPAFGRLTGAHRAEQRVGDKSSVDIYHREGSEAWFNTAKGTTTLLLDDYFTGQVMVDTLLPRLQVSDVSGSWSPVKLFAHGYDLSLGVWLNKRLNAVAVFVLADLPQSIHEGCVQPAWHLQCRLSRRVPGGDPGAYLEVWHTGSAGMGTQCGCGHCNECVACRFPAGRIVTNIANIEELLLLVGGRLLQLEVGACSTQPVVEGAAEA